MLMPALPWNRRADRTNGAETKQRNFAGMSAGARFCRLDIAVSSVHPGPVQIIEVTDFAVRSAVIRLRRSDSPLQFVVYPMVHMARVEFYAEVASRLAKAGVIVAEGVGPGARRAPSPLAAALTLSYRLARFNRRVRLVEQDIDYAAFGVPVVTPDVTMDEFRTAWRRAPLWQRLMMWCVLPVVMVGRLLGGSRAIWSRAMEVNDLPSEMEERIAEVAPELDEAFGGDRDRRLLDALRQLHDERRSEPIEVAVVYGAGHVPAIVHGLRRLGYVARSGDWLVVVDLLGSGSAAAVRPAPPPPPATSKPPATRPPAEAAVPEPTPPEPVAAPPEPTGPVDALPAEEREVARLRMLAARQPDAYHAPLADALCRLSDELADRARIAEATDAADEAVDIADGLRERFGASYARTYAQAAYTLGRRLHDAGRTGDATALYAEAVDVMRGINRNDPYERARSLGTYLTDYAGQLLRQGDTEQAVTIAEEAVALYREASVEAPDEFSHGWAFALRNVTIGLWVLGRDQEALDAAGRAVNVARRLARAEPDEAGILVDNLGRLARAYLTLDRGDDAVAAAEESVAAARALPPTERVYLAAALGVLGNILVRVGRPADAATVVAEAVLVWRQVVDAHPIRRDDLCSALAEHASLQRATGDGDRALASADEAERIASELAESNPDRWSKLLREVRSTLEPIRQPAPHPQTDGASQSAPG
jgi:tetratricopeptide (TPR) repeat protein